MPLLDLPTTIIASILCKLHATEFVVLRQICSRLRSLIDDSDDLQIRIELAIDGFMLGEPFYLDTVDLLAVVRPRRIAMDSMKPIAFWSVDVPQTNVHMLEVSEGVWAYSTNVAPDMHFRGIQLEELSHPQCEGGKWTMSVSDLDIEVADFSFWLGGGALVLMELLNEGATRRIHFRKLSSSQDHVSPVVPFVEFKQDDRLVWDHCEMIVKEERISVEFSDFTAPGHGKHTAATILEWTTGDTLLAETLCTDLAFLTKDLVVILRNDPKQENLTIEVRSLDTRSAIVHLRLPLRAQSFAPRFLKTLLSRPGPQSSTGIAKFIVPDPKVGILPIIVTEIVTTGSTFTIILSRQAILKLVDKVSLTSAKFGEEEADTTVPVLDWEEWGPDATRWLPSDIHCDFGSRTACGHRIVAVKTIGEEAQSPRYMILDFNTRTFGRGDESQSAFKHVDLPETFTEHGLQVTSRLPFRAWISPNEPMYLNLILTEHAILGRLEDQYHVFSFLPVRYAQTEEVPQGVL